MSHQKQVKRGQESVLIRREIAQWISQNTTNAKVNNWKVGGGRPAYNGPK